MDLLKRAKVLSVNLSWVECAFVCKKTYQLKNSLTREKSIVKYQLRGKIISKLFGLLKLCDDSHAMVSRHGVCLNAFF